MKMIMVAAILAMPVVANAQKPSAAPAEYMSVCGAPEEQPCAQPAKALKSPEPEYSKEAKGAKIQGMVMMKVLVGLDGRAHDIVVVSGPGYGLEAQAVNTITKKWKFQPPTFNGAPVVAWQQVRISFHLY